MNTYGRLSNASLIHMYGFAEYDNPNDAVSDITTGSLINTLTYTGIHSSVIDQTVIS